MKLLSRVIKSSDFLPVLIVLFFALLAGRGLLGNGYFVMHDDLQMMRQLEMEKCFKDLQIPCRWVPDMGYGFGFPLFNYYPPLPYLVGELFRLVGFSFVDTVKLTFILSFLISGVTMYLLSKEFFGKLGGVTSSVFYIWAPYHSVDVYVRGAMNEAWALSFFPLILWAGYKLIISISSRAGRGSAQAAKWVVVLALSWTALLLSHNLMVLIFAPVFAGWSLIWIWRSKTLVSNIKYLAASGLISLGLSAFFTLPSFLEQKYVQVNTLVTGYYEYIAHFATLNQLLFSRFWGYGPSVWLEGDGMSFQVGHVHWILSLIIIVVFIYRYIKTRKLNNLFLVIGYFIVVGWFAAFMAHLRSTGIWQTVEPLKFVQFPWRFLAIVILSFSFIAGSFVLFLRPLRMVRWTIAGLMIILLVAANWSYFTPKGGKLGPLTDEEKFSGAAWELQQTAGIYDYLPKDAKEAPKMARKYLAEILRGDGLITETSEGTRWASFKIEVPSKSYAKVRINIFKFPNWTISLDGKTIEPFMPGEEKWGRMWIDIPEGLHVVKIRLYDTPLRIISNFVSVLTWSGLTGFILWRRRSFLA